MSKYYKAEDVLAIFSEEERPLNWTDSESEIQAQNDFDCYKGMIESLPTIEINEDKEIELGAMLNGSYKLGFKHGKASVEVSEECIYTYCSRCGMRMVVDAPSVTTEQSSTVGEWQKNKTYRSIIFCSECGEPFEQSNSAEHWNYCPNCGAKMKG